ncbi:hypothetical protein [Sphingomonas dokdonensis]|nr:hypothetical protein [Sphingomonas dokdonensis]
MIAQVTGSGFSAQPGPVIGTQFDISGNGLAATAVGNPASSAIAAPH